MNIRKVLYIDSCAEIIFQHGGQGQTSSFIMYIHVYMTPKPFAQT